MMGGGESITLKDPQAVLGFNHHPCPVQGWQAPSETLGLSLQSSSLERGIFFFSPIRGEGMLN